MCAYAMDECASMYMCMDVAVRARNRSVRLEEIVAQNAHNCGAISLETFLWKTIAFSGHRMASATAAVRVYVQILLSGVAFYPDTSSK